MGTQSGGLPGWQGPAVGQQRAEGVTLYFQRTGKSRCVGRQMSPFCCRFRDKPTTFVAVIFTQGASCGEMGPLHRVLVRAFQAAGVACGYNPPLQRIARIYGGLRMFRHTQSCAALVANDPFVQERLLAQQWLPE
jgi:hypothetical protein